MTDQPLLDRIRHLTLADPQATTRRDDVLAGRAPSSLDLALIAEAGGVTVEWLLHGNPPADHPYRQLRASLEAEHAKTSRNAAAARDEATRNAISGIATGLHIALAHAIAAFEGDQARQDYLVGGQTAPDNPPTGSDGTAAIAIVRSPSTRPPQKAPASGRKPSPTASPPDTGRTCDWTSTSDRRANSPVRC